MKPVYKFLAIAALAGLGGVTGSRLTTAFTSTPRMAEALQHQRIFEQMEKAFAEAELRNAKRRNSAPAIPQQP